MAPGRTLFLLVIVAAAVPIKGQILNKTPHWQRCYEILKNKNSAQCTQHQIQDCQARKLPADALLGDENHCHGSDCPPPARGLHVSVYRQYASADTTKHHNYYGANVSWTVDRTGSDADFALKRFEARIELPTGKNFIAEIDVTLTPQDFINNKATIYYDCFYLLPDNKTLAAIVRTIPRKEDEFEYETFKTFSVSPSGRNG